MSTQPPSIFSAAFGQIRYRLALGVIGFGVYFGALLACLIPLCVYGSFFDSGGNLGEPLGWVIAGCFLFIPIAVTYRFRGWIIQKALTDVPPEPVKFWSAREVGEAGVALVQLGAGLIALVFCVITVAGLAYGGYLLLTVLTIPMAILVGAIIIALAVLVVAAQ